MWKNMPWKWLWIRILFSKYKSVKKICRCVCTRNSGGAGAPPVGLAEHCSRQWWSLSSPCWFDWGSASIGEQTKPGLLSVCTCRQWSRSSPCWHLPAPAPPLHISDGSAQTRPPAASPEACAPPFWLRLSHPSSSAPGSVSQPPLSGSPPGLSPDCNVGEGRVGGGQTELNEFCQNSNAITTFTAVANNCVFLPPAILKAGDVERGRLARPSTVGQIQPANSAYPVINQSLKCEQTQKQPGSNSTPTLHSVFPRSSQSGSL